MTIDQFREISEFDVEEYMGSQRREDTIPAEDTSLRFAIKLLHVGHFKYLLPCAVRLHWNMYGGINNTSAAGGGPEIKTQRGNGAVPVVNNVVAKKVFLSNIWGDEKKVSEGCRVGLILRRAGGESSKTVGAPEFVPWSDRDAETPALQERAYYDEWNRPQFGHYLPCGVVLEVRLFMYTIILF